MKEIKTKLQFILLFSCVLLFGFDKSEEMEILSVVESMITAINEKDAESYIQTLSDYFIKSRYGDKNFIRQNIKNFEHVDLLETKVVAINSYISYVNYRLIHTSVRNKKSTYYGELILEKTKSGWKVFSVSEMSSNKEVH